MRVLIFKLNEISLSILIMERVLIFLFHDNYFNYVCVYVCPKFRTVLSFG